MYSVDILTKQMTYFCPDQKKDVVLEYDNSVDQQLFVIGKKLCNGIDLCTTKNSFIF